MPLVERIQKELENTKDEKPYAATGKFFARPAIDEIFHHFNRFGVLSKIIV